MCITIIQFNVNQSETLVEPHVSKCDKIYFLKFEIGQTATQNKSLGLD